MLEGLRRDEDVIKEAEAEVDALPGAALDLAHQDLVHEGPEDQEAEVDFGVRPARAGQDEGLADADDVPQGDHQTHVWKIEAQTLWMTLVCTSSVQYHISQENLVL